MASSVLEKSFKITIVVKGLDGVLQVLGGILLYRLKPDTLHHIVAVLTQRDLSEDPQDRIAFALHLLYAAQRVSDAKTFGAIYLCTHGFLKIILTVSLLRGVLWAYPAMIGYVLLFMVYQLYRYYLSHAFGWFLLTGFDACIVWLTWHAYRKSRPPYV